MSNPSMRQMISDAALNAAYQWLGKKRLDYHHNNDVWQVRFHWQSLQEAFRQQLISGCYHLTECQRVKRACKISDLWCAQDALVLKALSLVLTGVLLPLLSKQCFHLAGRGGYQGAVRAVTEALGLSEGGNHQSSPYRFVIRNEIYIHYC
jgi:hypothetical protein